ncbi:MAG: hypothetical protein KF851_03450 [Pirellulaceae bacterium]|nr:hypothetical protein [Pirellulaceae bacterium]
METIYSCVAGLDIHKNTIAVCLRHTSRDGSLQEEVRTFATMTDEIVGTGRLAISASCHARGDGIDRRVVEADLEYPGKL